MEEHQQGWPLAIEWNLAIPWPVRKGLARSTGRGCIGTQEQGSGGNGNPPTRKEANPRNELMDTTLRSESRRDVRGLASPELDRQNRFRSMDRMNALTCTHHVFSSTSSSAATAGVTLGGFAGRHGRPHQNRACVSVEA